MFRNWVSAISARKRHGQVVRKSFKVTLASTGFPASTCSCAFSIVSPRRLDQSLSLLLRSTTYLANSSAEENAKGVGSPRPSRTILVTKLRLGSPYCAAISSTDCSANACHVPISSSIGISLKRQGSYSARDADGTHPGLKTAIHAERCICSGRRRSSPTNFDFGTGCKGECTVLSNHLVEATVRGCQVVLAAAMVAMRGAGTLLDSHAVALDR